MENKKQMLFKNMDRSKITEKLIFQHPSMPTLMLKHSIVTEWQQ